MSEIKKMSVIEKILVELKERDHTIRELNKSLDIDENSLRTNINRAKKLGLIKEVKNQFRNKFKVYELIEKPLNSFDFGLLKVFINYFIDEDLKPNGKFTKAQLIRTKEIYLGGE